MPQFKHFPERADADTRADALRQQPSRSHRAFRVIERHDKRVIRRDTYSGRRVLTCVLCTDGRFRATQDYD